MKSEYLPILDLKKRFSGANQGFKFLDSFLDKLKKNKNQKNIEPIIVYDYRDNSNIKCNLDYYVLYNLIQNNYIDFLTKEKFHNYSWYVLLKKEIYCILGKDFRQSDIFSDTIIKIFTKALVCFSNYNNKINFIILKSYIIFELNQLSDDLVESENYTNFIIQQLILKNFFILENDIISIVDRFIYIDFWITSLDIVNFNANDFELSYSCKYGFETLLTVIDNYLSSLLYTDSYFESKELFSFNSEYKECFPFLMNYDDLDCSKIPELESPFDKLFNAFFFKKLLLNEYCFHTIVMSCFKKYIFNPRIKNILMEKADPELKLKSENDNIYILFR